MNFYQKRILPKLIDRACGMDVISQERRKLIPAAYGRVLEIGIGSGLNAPFYDGASVEKLWGLEPSAELREMALSRMAIQPFPVELIEGSAEQIPLSDRSMDTVVTTYTLCTIPDPARALRQMRRVLKPEGQLLFAEHGKAPDAAVRWWQNLLTPVWKPIAGGCHLNRDIPLLIRNAGFQLTQLEDGYLPGPKPMTFSFRGSAAPA